MLTAAIWHGEHQLAFAYLLHGPRLRFWRIVGGDGDEVTVDWQHEDDGDIGSTGGQAVLSLIGRPGDLLIAIVPGRRDGPEAGGTGTGRLRLSSLTRRAGVGRLSNVIRVAAWRN